MNLILIRPSELDGQGHCTLDDRRAQHVHKILKSEIGDRLKVGLLGVPSPESGLGTGIVLGLRPLVLECRFDRPAPPKVGIALILAMPRPIALQRLLRQIAELGADSLDLVMSAKCEKSYLDSRVFEKFEEHMIQGLEQSGDTTFPEVRIHRRFRDFLGHARPDGCLPAERAVAHVGGHPSLEASGLGLGGRLALAIGPDGGWIDDEVESLKGLGFQPIGLGPRVLRVDTAVAFGFGQWAVVRQQNDARRSAKI